MKINTLSRAVVVSASLLMIVAYFVPLWQILMWAPQYPEWLGMKIWINTITGDVNTINGLNHYIGMKLIKPEMFPEFNYMIYLLAGLISLGLITGIAGKRWMLWSYAGLMILTALAALIDFYLWGYDYGHNLDPHAAIQVPGMVYQPPIIGTKQLLNFTAYSGPDIGGWIFISAGLLVLAALFYDKFKKK